MLEPIFLSASKRRIFLVSTAAWLAWPVVDAWGQAKAPRRIAYLSPAAVGPALSNPDALRASLREFGYVEGRDIVFEIRIADARPEKLPALAAELVALDPAVLVTNSSAGVIAAKNASASVPIVFGNVFNPVEQGFVASLRRPGGNITGVLVRADLDRKVLELLRETMPAARRLALLVHDADPAHRIVLEQFLPSATSLGFETLIVRMNRVEDVDRAFGEIAAWKPDAIYTPQLVFFRAHGPRVAELAFKAKIPVFSRIHESARNAGLMSYDMDQAENFRHAGRLVARILKGANPGELPVEQANRYHLVVNMRTATALGIKIPKSVLLRADEVID